jgi:putative hemolysin
MKRPIFAFLVFLAVAFALLVPSLKPVLAGAATLAEAEPDAKLTAAEYCQQKGGEVDARQPYFNTNDIEQNWLRLSGGRDFCKFTSKKDGSRIHVLVSTLYSEQPTLAALAYYAQLPLGSGCNGNPASCYCTQLGGSDLFGGVNLNGGGWVMKSDPVDTVVEACIFPDMSSIDSWGLAYHSAGIIRGKDLSKVLRFKNPYAK